VPQADPQPPDRAGGRRQFERVIAPCHRILAAPVLAQGAIHPREWHLVDPERRACGGIPSRHDVCDAEAKPVAVREPERRIVGEPGGRHRPLSDPGMDADVMLAHAADGCAGQSLEAGPLRGEGVPVIQRGEAAVQGDLVAGGSDPREDVPRLG